MGADFDNFDHGDTVVMDGGVKARVWKPRWWQIWRHLIFLWFRCQQRAQRFTMADGAMWLIIVHDSRHKGDS